MRQFGKSIAFYCPWGITGNASCKSNKSIKAKIDNLLMFLEFKTPWCPSVYVPWGQDMRLLWIPCRKGAQFRLAASLISIGSEIWSRYPISMGHTTLANNIVGNLPKDRGREWDANKHQVLFSQMVSEVVVSIYIRRYHLPYTFVFVFGL